jgi:undecaprenyl-diphosphatase
MIEVNRRRKARISARLLGLAIVLAIAASSILVLSQAGYGKTATGGPAVESRAGEASLDVKVFRFLNTTIANPVFDTVMPFATDFRKWRIFALAAWVALMILGGSKGRWAALLLIPLVAASDQLTSSVLKPLTARLRPCEVLGNVHFWYEGNRWIWTPSEAVGGFKTSFGFPSSHAANFTAAMLFLSLVYRRWVPYVCLPFAGLVSLSRIYTGVHWPSDVLVGIMIGAALAWLAYIGFKRLPTPHRIQK